MAKDRRLVDPNDYIEYTKDPFIKKRQVNFDDSFQAKASTGVSPWMPSRFEQQDLLRRVQTRKAQLNPGLNFLGDSPEVFEVFAGIGRFTRKDNYDFENGRPLTALRPEEQPGFSDIWVEAYKLSPTLNPDKRASNPMPRLRNPDPKGYLMATAEKRVENETEDNKSVAQLLASKTEDKAEVFKRNNEDVKKA